MCRSQRRAIKYILLLGVIVMISGCAQVAGALAGAAVQGIASAIVNPNTYSGGSQKAEYTATKTQEEQKAAAESRSQPQKLAGPPTGTGDQPAKESPVPYDIIAKLEKKEIKFNKVSAVLKTIECANGNQKVVTKMLDENEVNKIIRILTKCGVYDEVNGNSLLTISFIADGMKCNKVIYNFKYDNNYHTIVVDDQKISYRCAGSNEIDLDNKLSCNFLETIKKDIAMRAPEMDDDEG
jgi:hypothetical protein